MPDSWTIVGLLIALTHVAGLFTAIHVLMTGRTPQGALAWIFSLLLFPYLAVPLYWVFGPRRYDGYIDSRLTSQTPFDEIVGELHESGGEYICDRDAGRSSLVALERIVRLPFTHGNEVQLLVDGEATFRAFFEAIRGAQRYIAVQFFIVHDDHIGRDMKDALIERARAGV